MRELCEHIFIVIVTLEPKTESAGCLRLFVISVSDLLSVLAIVWLYVPLMYLEIKLLYTHSNRKYKHVL